MSALGSARTAGIVMAVSAAVAMMGMYTAPVLGGVGAFAVDFGAAEVVLANRNVAAVIPIGLVVLVSTVFALVLTLEAMRRDREPLVVDEVTASTLPLDVPEVDVVDGSCARD